MEYRLTDDLVEGGLAIEFPPGYRPGDSADVNLYYDSTSNLQSSAARRIQSALTRYGDRQAEQELEDHGLTLGDLRSVRVVWIDTAPKEAQGAGFLSMLLPYFVLIYIFAGSMNIGLDTTAGEKERGSLASILVNQVSRTSIALGKILYVVSAGLVNSISSFAGIVIALTWIGSRAFGGVSTNLALFSVGNVLGLLVVLLSLSALAASIVVLLGSFAKNMKEGGTLILPVYIITIMVGVALVQMDAARSAQLFLIPVVNSVFALKEILVGQLSLVHLGITVGINMLAAAILVRLIARLYNSEKILNTV